MKKRMPGMKNRHAVVAAGFSSLVMFSPASAFELDFDDPRLTGRLDTSVTVGAQWRTQRQSSELSASEDPVAMAQKGYSTQLNKNDANNNFDPGLTSLNTRITPELELVWDYRYGIVAQATTNYDHVIMDGGHDGGQLNRSAPQPSNGINRYATFSHHANNGTGDRFGDAARDYAGQRTRMLEAYAWGDFELFDRPLNVRAGRRVINWGEALFIQNSINTANKIDLATLRQPGSEIRDALIPIGSLSFSYDLTFDLSMEAFYQYEWKQNEDAAAGTFFNTHDAFPARGADNVIVDGRLLAAVAGSPAIADGFANYTDSTYNSQSNPGAYDYEATQVTVNRTSDEDASSGGQFGLAFRYFTGLFGGTELGFYYTRTHAKLPLVGAQFNEIVENQGAEGAARMIDTTEYNLAYLDDIDMFGASFSTGLGPMALSGELAFRDKQPIANEVGDNLLRALSQISAASNLQGQAPRVGDLTDHCVRGKLGGSCLDPESEIQEGQRLYAYDEARTFHGSLVSIFDLGRHFGMDSVTTVIELGGEYVSGLDSSTTDVDGNKVDLHYNSTAAIADFEAEVRKPGDVYGTYMDDFSWGYRAVLRGRYTDLFAGLNMEPQLFFSHDVSGNSYIGGNFMEGRRAATLSTKFIHLDNMEVALSGTRFWGAGYSNKMRDRNHAALSFRYAF